MDTASHIKLLERMEAIVKPTADNLTFGRPTAAFYSESQQTSYWLRYQQPCGHKKDFTIVHANGELHRREYGITGKFVSTYTEEQAIAYLREQHSTIPGRRRTFIAEIESSTLKQILKGEKLFVYTDDTKAKQHIDSVKDLWAPEEIKYAKGIKDFTKAFRSFTESQFEDERCICRPKEMHLQPSQD